MEDCTAKSVDLNLMAGMSLKCYLCIEVCVSLLYTSILYYYDAYDYLASLSRVSIRKTLTALEAKNMIYTENCKHLSNKFICHFTIKYGIL